MTGRSMPSAGTSTRVTVGAGGLETVAVGDGTAPDAAGLGVAVGAIGVALRVGGSESGGKGVAAKIVLGVGTAAESEGDAAFRSPDGAPYESSPVATSVTPAAISSAGTMRPTILASKRMSDDATPGEGQR